MHKTHHDGDCLSRYPVESPAELLAMEAKEMPLDDTAVDEDAFRARQKQDRFIANIVRQRQNGDAALNRQYEVMGRSGIVYRRCKLRGTVVLLLVVPKDLRAEILERCHDDRVAGHLGFARTSARVGQRFWFPDWLGYTKNYVKTCVECQTRNVNTSDPCKVFVLSDHGKLLLRMLWVPCRNPREDRST